MLYRVQSEENPDAKMISLDIPQVMCTYKKEKIFMSNSPI
jgi:hypothetical protein